VPPQRGRRAEAWEVAGWRPGAGLLGALALAALFAACGERAQMVDGMPGAALQPWDPPAELAEGPAIEAAAAARDPAEALGLRWRFEPPELQVYRPTAVHFRVEALPPGREGARCEWSFGDGMSRAEGCAVSHTFHGGRADERVTLTVRDGDWELSSTRVVPLERLPVTVLTDGVAAPGELPEPPRPGATSYRLLLLADSAGHPEPGRVVASLLERLSPDLIVHLGGVVPPGGGDDAWDRARDGIERHARGAGVPLTWAMSPTDLAEGARVRRPAFELLEGAAYPERYAFSFRGTYFVVIAGDASGALDAAGLAWMRARLEEGQVYESRVVLSHLPLHPFAEDGAGALSPKLRIYELLLRARVTALFSAGHQVYFKGRYGALPVVSAGALADRGGRLAGTDFEQPGSVVLVDVVRGTVERVFAVAAPTWDALLDERELPEMVEVYTR